MKIIKVQTGLLFSLLVIFSAQEVEAQGADPCAGVSCAGYGNCIVVEGRPACACNPGYTTDSTGLNCVSTGQPAPTVEIRRSRLHGFYTWLLGVIFIPTGTALASAGFGLVVNFYEEGIPMAAIGCSMLTAGIVQTIVGGVLLRRDRRQRQAGMSRVTLAPSVSPTNNGGLTLGLSGAFF